MALRTSHPNGALAIASLHFGSGFGAVMSSLIKQQMRPGEIALECLIQRDSNDEEFACRPLLELLNLATPPSAIIGITIRPIPEVAAAIRARSIPLVLIDDEAEGTSSVGSDNLAGGALAARRFVQLGRKNPAVVCGRRNLRGAQNAVLRVRGFEGALKDAGLALDPANVLEVVHYSRKDGVTSMLELLDRRPAIDAIFCAAGDVCAAGMLSVAHQRRVKIPEEIAIIGFDDLPMSQISEPPLSTIRQPLERIAAAAYQLATQRTAADAPKRLLFEPELVVRRSA